MERLDALLMSGAEAAITEPVIMELLAGARRPAEIVAIEHLVEGLAVVSVDPLLDYRAAAELFRASAVNGHPVRSMNDCLITAVAIRRMIPLLQQDRDFSYLAEISPLRLLEAA